MDVEEHGDLNCVILIPNGEVREIEICWCLIYKLFQNDEIKSNLDIKTLNFFEDVEIAYDPSDSHPNPFLQKTKFKNLISGVAICFSKTKNLNSTEIMKLLKTMSYFP